MKKTIKIELPDRAEIVAGLTTRELHPPLARAVETLSESQAVLDRRRRDLVDREQLVAELPARIQRGDVKATALNEALRDRDAAALLIPPADAALSKARDKVTAAERAAKLAVEQEWIRRVEKLEQVAAQLAPVLDEIDDLGIALAAAHGPGGLLGLDWPCSPICRGRLVAFSRGAGAAK